MPDVGYYTLPVILSMEGIDKQVNGKLGKAFEGIGGKAGKSLSAGVATGARAAEADLKKLGDSYTKLKDKADDALGKVRKDEAALQELRDKGVTSGARFVAAEERLNTSRRNSVRALADSKRAHGELGDAQKKLGDSSSKAGGKLQALSGMAGTAGKALTAAGVVAAGAATAGVLALAAGIVVAGKALYDLGGQFDEISDDFVIKLGATGDKLAALNQQVYDLGPTMASSLGEIASITTDVNRHLEGSTVELENVTQAVGDLNRMTGTQTNIKKFGQLLTQWNIPAKDQVKTLDMLFNVSRRTGQPVNDLMETLTGKGATALRELNIPLDQAIGLFVQLQGAGLDAAGSIEALAKLQKYAATEGISMADALTRTYNAIKAGDAEAGFKAFGKSAGPLIEAVQEGRLSLKDFYAALEEGGPTISETATLTDDFAQKWQKLKNRLEIAIQPVASAVFDTINAKLSSIGDWIIAHQSEVMTFIGDIGVGLLEAGKSAVTFAQDVLRAIKSVIEGYNSLPWPFGPDEPVDTGFIDRTITSLDGVKDKLSGAQDWWRNYTDRAAAAVSFTEELGDAVRATVNEGGEIELSAKPTDEQTAALLAKGVAVKEIDGKITAVATTPEGQRILDAFRGQKLGLPIEAQPRIDPGAKTTLQSDLDKMAPWVIGVQPAPAPGPAPAPAPRQQPIIPTPPATRHYATGGAVPGPGAKPAARSSSSADVEVFNRINAQLARTVAQSRQLLDNIKATVNASGQITITTNEPEVQAQLAAIGLSTEQLPDGTIGIAADTTEGEQQIADFKRKATEGKLVLKTELAEPPPLPLPASGGLPAGGPTAGGGSANPKGLDKRAASVMADLHAAYPQMDLWGWGPNPDHNSGKCVDAMTLDNPNGLALGDRIVSSLLKDPRVDYIIWKQMTYDSDGSVRPYGDHGDRNANHFTHPHIRTFQFGGVPGTGRGDIVPALLEPGEHVLTRGDVGAMGGQGAVYAFRNALHGYQDGGPIVPDYGPLNPIVAWPVARFVEGLGKLGKLLVSGDAKYTGGRPSHYQQGGQVPDWDAIAVKESGGRWNIDFGDADSTGGLQIQTRTWLDFGGDAYAPTAGQATKEQQIAIAEKILAKQGPGAWAGGKNFVWKTDTGGPGSTSSTSTSAYVAGTGPGGEQGYYKPADAEKIRGLEAKIAELEGKQREDKAKLGELKADATESERIAAQNELDATTRELSNTKAELGEARTGEFTAGTPPSTHYEPYEPSEVRGAEAKLADAAGKLAEAEAQLRELKSDATESERIAAQNKVAAAKAEKANAEADLADKRKGKLVEGEEGNKVEIDPQLNQLAAMPGGIINGLLGDLGIGDIFPDLTQTPMWKSFAAGLTAFKGPIQGLVEGKLGIQQPGWQPGMPVPEGSGDAGLGGGSGFSIPGMFGLPNIEIPPPPGPPDAAHMPGAPGAAGPGNPINIDASVNYHDGSVLGVDPVAQRQADERRQGNNLAATVAPLDPANH